MQITHAVIPCAGFGTRMLPLSKAVPKELLPLGRLPAIAYVVQEAIAAGIKTIVLVSHAQKTAIEQYFDVHAELDHALRSCGKETLADSLNPLPEGVSVVSVRQGRPLGLGHAVLQAKAVVGDNPFAVLLPDVVLDPYVCDYACDNLSHMLKRFAQSHQSQVLVAPIAPHETDKYGIARLKAGHCVNANQRSFAVDGFVEKPAPKDAPSNLAVVGRYVFDAVIFEYLAQTVPSVGGEIQLTDAMDALIAKLGVEVATLSGAYFDVGEMTNYLKAFGYFAAHQEMGA